MELGHSGKKRFCKNVFTLLRSIFHRTVTGGWLMSSLIITASYGGNLRAFLLMPKYTLPIENMKEVVESALPWTMVLYGEEVETYLEQSVDPVEKGFWDGKTVIPYNEFPLEQVLHIQRYFLKTTIIL